MGAEGRLGSRADPVTYAAIGWLKRREGIDAFDTGFDLTPCASVAAVSWNGNVRAAKGFGLSARPCPNSSPKYAL
jgi:hypothetical protein